MIQGIGTAQHFFPAHDAVFQVAIYCFSHWWECLFDSHFHLISMGNDTTHTSSHLWSEHGQGNKETKEKEGNEMAAGLPQEEMKEVELEFPEEWEFRGPNGGTCTPPKLDRPTAPPVLLLSVGKV